jgi:hypothetical protein
MDGATSTMKTKSLLGSQKLIKLSPILEILQAAIWTGRLSDEKPVSILLIAEQESAKTECLKFFRGTATLKFLSDLTSRGFVPYKNDIESFRIRHFVLLDLVRIISHNRTVTDRTLQTCASLMEEGESETSDAGGKDSWAGFPKVGFLMSITPSFFKSKRGHWRDTGFLSRFLPVSFSYTEETVREIHKSIAYGKHLPAAQPETIPEAHYQVDCSHEFSAAISRRAQTLGESMKTYGFRYHRVMRCLAKSKARLSGRGQVNSEDVAKVLEWSEFFSDKEIVL